MGECRKLRVRIPSSPPDQDHDFRGGTEATMALRRPPPMAAREQETEATKETKATARGTPTARAADIHNSRTQLAQKSGQRGPKRNERNM